jgi:hypothetical protein
MHVTLPAASPPVDASFPVVAPSPAALASEPAVLLEELVPELLEQAAKKSTTAASEKEKRVTFIGGAKHKDGARTVQRRPHENEWRAGVVRPGRPRDSACIVSGVDEHIREPFW